MRINHLTIYNFKNLHNFTINFNQEFSNTVILGRNGVGKSNLLEALIIIFRDLDLGLPPRFPYHMIYTCREQTIMIDADPDRLAESVRISVNETYISYARFQTQPGRPYLPSRLFGYHSGPSDRMEQHFVEHQRNLYIDLIKGIDTGKQLQPLLYVQPIRGQFALLILLSQEDPVFLSILKEHLGVERLDSVLFVIHKPSWMRDSPDAWSAGGDSSDFLDRVQTLTPVPTNIPQYVDIAPPNQSTDVEHLYLYLPGKAAARKLLKLYGDDSQELFRALENASISGILSDLRIQVQSHEGHPFTLHLSEGERQLLTVLSLLRITRNDEALFLLDEPDSHLNPAWSIQYADLLRKVVGPQETSQVIMTTHNPLVVSNLGRLQVRVIQRNGETGQIIAEVPYESPIGMGVDNILTSDLFGLRSALDLPTQHKVDRRRELAIKYRLTLEEEDELEQLNRELIDIDFSIGTRDTEYAQYIRAKIAREDQSLRKQIILTPRQQEEQRELIKEILDELVEENRGA